MRIMFGAQLPRRGFTGSAANGYLQQQQQLRQQRQQQQVADKKAQIRADLEKQRVALDSHIRSIRARPHAVLFDLNDEIAMGMARRLSQEEDRVRYAEELIRLGQEKKAAALRHSKLNEWLDDNKRGGLADMRKVQSSLKRQLESGDDRLAQELLSQGKAIAGKSQQNSLLLFKAAAHYYSATGQDRPKLTKRIKDMEDSVAKLTAAGVLKPCEHVVLNEALAAGPSLDEDTRQQAILASDPRSALQMAKDKWQKTTAGWKSLSPEKKKAEVEHFQRQIKSAISATAKQICIDDITKARWDTMTDDEQQSALRAAEVKVEERRRKAALDTKVLGIVPDPSARMSIASSGKKKDGTKLVNQILAHHAKLRSILDEIEADSHLRAELESKACSSLLDCDEGYVKIVLMQCAQALNGKTKELKKVETAVAENDREAEELDQKLDSSIKKLWMRFVAKHHPDKPGSRYAGDYDGWGRAEQAGQVLRDRRVRLLYFNGQGNENITVDSTVNAEDEQIVQAIQGATPNRCTVPWLTERQGGTVDLDWSCAGAAFSGVHTYRLQGSKSLTAQSWDTIWEGPRPSTTIAAKHRSWVFRCCAINGFGSGGWSSSTSLVQQQAQEEKKRSSVKTQNASSTKMTRKQALELRRKQEAREQLQHAMSSHGQRAVNAYEILIDAIAAFRKLKLLSAGHSSSVAAEDNELIQRAKSLSATLKSRKIVKAEISEWKHQLKHLSNNEIVSMLNAIQSDDVNPTVVNMIKQTIDKRSASDDFAEMREVLLAAAQRSDIFKREWQNHFFMLATEMQGKIVQQKQAHAKRQAQLEAERQKKEQARAAAETERRRRQEEHETYQQQRELAAIARAEQESRHLSKAQKKNARRRAKKSANQQQQEDVAEVIERQQQEVDRHMAERDAELARRERERDVEERDRLQEVLLREMQQQQQRQQVVGPSGWEGVDDYRARTLDEEVSTVDAHVRAGSTAENDVRRVAGRASKSKGKKGKKAHTSETFTSPGQGAHPNKQPSTPVREVHATKEPEPALSAEPRLVWGRRPDSAPDHLDVQSAPQLRQLEVERTERKAEQERATRMAADLERARAELQRRDEELEAFRRQQQSAMQQQSEVSRLSSYQTFGSENSSAQSHNLGEGVGQRSVVEESRIVMAEAVTVSLAPAEAAAVSTTSREPALIAAPAETQAACDDSGEPCAFTAEMLESDEDYRVLSAFLSAQGMARHQEKLVENEVSFDTLLMFTEEDYKEVGIAKGPRVKMLRTCQTWYKEQLDKLQQQ